MKFFNGKKPSSKKAFPDESLDDRDRPRDDFEQPPPYSEPSSPAKSPTKSSPTKRSSRPASYVEPKTSRSSRLSRHSTDPGHSSRRSKVDPNTHPLNLPPEERKRLSALATSAMNSRDSMDIDREPVNGNHANSTPPPKSSAQANFSVPITNGHANRDQAPTPPPHKSNPSSPTPTSEDDAESYKAAGNRFFKDRNYPKAIEQYSKGMRRRLCFNVRCLHE
jgi:DnaJ homolog subfamily C member 7